MRIMRGLSVFSRHLPSKGNMSGINIVVSKLNLNEIPKLIRFTTEIGFYASLIPVHVSSGGNGGREKADEFIVRADSPDFAFTDEDHAALDSVYSRVIQMKKDGFLVYNSNRFLKESPDFLKHKKIHWKCDSPTLYFSISPEGRFLPCVDIKTDKSMLKSNFLETYRSTDFIREIKGIVDKCPGCMYACWPEITYLCRDARVFTERMIQGMRVGRYSRRVLTMEEMVKRAEEIRNGA